LSVKKRVRRNYYKNSRAQRIEQFLSHCLMGFKVLLLAGGFAATSLLSILAYDAVTQSAYFEARRITVQGNKELSRDMILQQAGVKLHDNILSVNVSALRSRILVHPWIASAEVARELPDAIHIQVKEHVPIAMIQLDKRYYIGEDGQIFKPVSASDKIDFPLVTGFESDLDRHDPWHSGLFSAVMEVLRLTRLDRDAVTSQSLQRIHVDEEMGLTLYAFVPMSHPYVEADFAPLMGEGLEKAPPEKPSLVTIKIGFGDYESKYDRLGHVMSHLNGQDHPLKFQCIDLTDVDRVVVRPSESGQAAKRSVAHEGSTWRRPGKEV
jgi:cell division protein FtsQ